jgi:hypothetical protein
MINYLFLISSYLCFLFINIYFVYPQNNTKAECIEYIDSCKFEDAIICINSSNQFSQYVRFYYLAKCNLAMGQSLDTVFEYLESYVNLTCDNKYFDILVDPVFYSLHSYSKWEGLRKLVLECRIKSYPTLDSTGVKLLMNMFEEDQMYRMLKFKSVGIDYNHYKRNDLRDQIVFHDSLARIYFFQYIDLYGWPSKNDSSSKEILFFLTLVVHHSPFEISSSYKSLFRTYFKQGLIDGSTWAAYVDRYLAKKGRHLRFSVPLRFEPQLGKYVNDERWVYRVSRINRNRRKVGIEPFTLPYRY